MKHKYLLLFGVLLTLHTAFTQSTNCDPSAQCFSEKHDHTRSVARMTIPINATVNRLCTCTMINNEHANGRPFAITAAHCIDTDNDGVLSGADATRLASAFFDFRFWRTGCNGTENNPGIRFEGGATLRAHSMTNDYALIELNLPPGIGDGVNYAGWNRQGPLPTGSGSFVIHHPQGEDMRLTIVQNIQHYPLNSTRFWQTYYTEGTADRGSSGAGLFNPNGQIIGVLSSGWSSCNFTDFSDRYGKVDWAWYNGGLQSWLSPNLDLISMNLLDLTNIPINGPITLSCSNPAAFSTYPNLHGVTYSWTVTSGLQIKSGQGTSSVSVAGVPGYGAGYLTLTLESPGKGQVRNYTTTRRINISNGSLSGTYNSPTGSTTPLISSPTSYNNSCLATFTRMTIPSGSTPIWTANSLSPGVSWTVSGKDISVYFTAINQTADFTLTTTASGNCTALGRYRFKCVNNSSCGGVNPLIAVSPNPVMSEITLSVAKHGDRKTGEPFGIGEVRIINKMGQVVKIIRNAALVSKITINVADLPHDIYSIMYFDGKHWKFDKVVHK